MVHLSHENKVEGVSVEISTLLVGGNEFSVQKCRYQASVKPPPEESGLSNATHQGNMEETIDLGPMEKIIDEIILTEARYLEDCQCLLKEYYEPMKDAAQGSRDPINQLEKIDRIFANIEAITEIHASIVRCLPSLADSALYKLERIVQVYSKHMSAMRTHYSIFAVAQQSSKIHINNLEADQTWCSRLEAITARAGPNNSLDSLLIRPIQRICRYPLLFEHLSTEASKLDQGNAEELQDLQNRSVRMVDYVNSLSRASENQRKIANLSKRLIGFNLSFSLLGENLVVERKIKLWEPRLSASNEATTLHAVLFSKYLLLSIETKEKKRSWRSAESLEKRTNRHRTPDDSSRLKCKFLIELAVSSIYPNPIIVGNDEIHFWIDHEGTRYVFVEDSVVRAEWWIRELIGLGAKVSTQSAPPSVFMTSRTTTVSDEEFFPIKRLEKASEDKEKLKWMNGEASANSSPRASGRDRPSLLPINSGFGSHRNSDPKRPITLAPAPSENKMILASARLNESSQASASENMRVRSLEDQKIPAQSSQGRKRDRTLVRMFTVVEEIVPLHAEIIQWNPEAPVVKERSKSEEEPPKVQQKPSPSATSVRAKIALFETLIQVNAPKLKN